MARQKIHADNAARQAAYRERRAQGAAYTTDTVEITRAAYEAHERRFEALQAAIAGAVKRNDPLAIRIRAASVETMLDNLIDVFYESQ